MKIQHLIPILFLAAFCTVSAQPNIQTNIVHSTGLIRGITRTILLTTNQAETLATQRADKKLPKVRDLGVIHFTDQTKKQRFALGGGTNCIVGLVTNCYALNMTNYTDLDGSNYYGPLVYVEFNATNTDRTLWWTALGWAPVTLGQTNVYESHEIAIQFSGEYDKQ